MRVAALRQRWPDIETHLDPRAEQMSELYKSQPEAS
jgi:hypothetical protein